MWGLWSLLGYRYDRSTHSRIVSNERTVELLEFKKEDWAPIETGVQKTIDWYVSTHDKNEISQNLEILLKER